jgi:hypothetical protein
MYVRLKDFPRHYLDKENTIKVNETHTTGNNSTTRNVRLNTLEVLTEHTLARRTSHYARPIRTLDARKDSRANLETLGLRAGLIGQDAEELFLGRGGRHIAGLEG